MSNSLPVQTALHFRIADAIREGAGDAFVRLERSVSESRVFIAGCDEPIRCVRDDVILPEPLKPWAPGIRMDVQAVLAEFG
jgi:hypothetical protein